MQNTFDRFPGYSGDLQDGLPAFLNLEFISSPLQMGRLASSRQNQDRLRISSTYLVTNEVAFFLLLHVFPSSLLQ
jgi:hypothetical protein